MSEEKNEKKESRVNPAELPVPEVLSVLPLHEFVFYPGMGFPLQVSSASSRQLIDDALLQERMIAIVSHKKIEGEEPPKLLDTSYLFSVGVVGYIHKINKTSEEIYQVLISASKKIRILDYTAQEPYLKAKVEVIEMKQESDKEVEALVLNLRNQFKKLTKLSQLPPELLMTIMALTDPFFIGYLIVSQLNLSLQEEQEILEMEDLKKLLRRATTELNKRLETVEMSQDIQKAVKEDMDEKQREFFLRQQLKAIRKELGEGDDKNTELEELKKRVAETPMGDEIRKVAEKELDRLARINPSSPEHTVSRNYLEWILDLPWQISTTDNLDIELARETLDQDHYGLEKIKKRIIEFLAVRKLKNDMHGPILCFVGPPGVGKTSLGQSIARTMGRKFVRISLGGVRDEAEIRGHRRTYIGALPGRIIQSLKKAGSNNPLFMLDEIDKLGMDFRGDPSSALLEVLDPEQNFTFADHYLEIPFDLSKVMFITTANILDTIPGPLRDRMEVVELPGYTEDEKLMIAKRHLITKQLEAHALSADDLTITDEAIRAIIRSYTREAGVRNLERRLAAICRGVAMEIVTGNNEERFVGADDLQKYLGPIRYFPEMTTRSWGPGLATGLAWTPVGGQLLFIESAKMAGRGGLALTGKLGEVMKESASAALTYIRSNAAKMKIDEKIFSKTDIHVHVPEGAIPKDGPSAGVAIVVSLISLLTNRPVRKDIAMTGEITLRGDVLPVGGIKEKVLAAIQSGIQEIILPYLNEKDVVEIPDNVKEGITFHFVQGIEDALGLALTKKRGGGRRKK
jgi:ATP-dependent Lon protease